MHTIFNELINEWDEITSITYVGEQDTIDINVTGNRLFYANDILTHNSAVEEVEFDHSHISGGISKINTADNVFGIFTSRAMRERGRYQIQCMKTRSSTGVGQKIDLEYNIETMRITDPGLEQEGFGAVSNSASILNQIKTSATVSKTSKDTSGISDTPKTSGEAQSNKLKAMLAGLKSRE